MEQLVYAYVDICTWHVGSGPAIMDQKIIAMSETDRLASLTSDSSGDPFVHSAPPAILDDQKHHVVLPAFIFVHF